MRRIIILVVLVALLLAGCANIDVRKTYGLGEDTVTISARNGYLCNGYDVAQAADGSYTVTVKFKQVTANGE